jgi:hypothetical protein
MPATIFQGSKVKALKDTLSLNGKSDLISTTLNPPVDGLVAPVGSLALSSVNGKVYKKTGSNSTDWSELGAGGGSGSPNDIPETSFSPVNNQTSPANVTGLTFNNAQVRSFEALVSVAIDATSSLFESIKLHGIQKDSGWMMSQTGVGDNSGITFSITSTGQVQYVSGNNAGFTSATIKFRAITTGL